MVFIETRRRQDIAASFAILCCYAYRTFQVHGFILKECSDISKGCENMLWTHLEIMIKCWMNAETRTVLATGMIDAEVLVCCEVSDRLQRHESLWSGVQSKCWPQRQVSMPLESVQKWFSGYGVCWRHWNASRGRRNSKKKIKLHSSGELKAWDSRKHIFWRKFVLEKVEREAIRLIYCMLRDMIADIFYHPISRVLFERQHTSWDWAN